MNGAVGDFRGLLELIKKEPKKYLNVRVSIFHPMTMIDDCQLMILMIAN